MSCPRTSRDGETASRASDAIALVRRLLRSYARLRHARSVSQLNTKYFAEIWHFHGNFPARVANKHATKQGTKGSSHSGRHATYSSPPAPLAAAPALLLAATCLRVDCDRNQLVNRSTFFRSAELSVLYFKHWMSLVTFNTNAPSQLRYFVTKRVCGGNAVRTTPKQRPTALQPTTPPLSMIHSVYSCQRHLIRYKRTQKHATDPGAGVGRQTLPHKLDPTCGNMKLKTSPPPHRRYRRQSAKHTLALTYFGLVVNISLDLSKKSANSAMYTMAHQKD